MRWTLLAPALLFLGGGSLASGDKAGDVKLQSVKYDALKDFVHKNRGKVLVLDFWYNT